MNQPCTITLAITQTDAQSILIQVSDNGPGFLNSHTNKRQSSGVGIKNIRERIQLYYGEKASLEIASIPYQETTISLILPVKSTEV